MSVRMTHRERVLAAVDRQETDRPPIDFGGTLATTIVPSTYEELKHYNIQEQVPPENIVAMFEACLSNHT